METVATRIRAGALAGFVGTMLLHAATTDAASLGRTAGVLAAACALLAAGVCAHAARRAWTARTTERMVSDRYLRGLAKGLRAAVAESARGPSPYRVTLSGAAVRDPAARAACLALADALERARPADPRLVLRALDLVRECDSPLAGDCPRRLAEDAGGLARGLVLHAARRGAGDDAG